MQYNCKDLWYNIKDSGEEGRISISARVNTIKYLRTEPWHCIRLYRNYTERKKKMDRKYKPALAVGVLILLVAVIGVLSTVIIRHIPTKEKMDLN